MPTCPQGHDSPTDDYCDVCGLAITPSPSSHPGGDAGSISFGATGMAPVYSPPPGYGAPPTAGGLGGPGGPGGPGAGPGAGAQGAYGAPSTHPGGGPGGTEGAGYPGGGQYAPPSGHGSPSGPGGAGGPGGPGGGFRGGSAVGYGGAAAGPAAPAGPTTEVRCPICGTVQTERYCEECGYDYELSSPSQRARFQPPQPRQEQPPAGGPGGGPGNGPGNGPGAPGDPGGFGGPSQPSFGGYAGSTSTGPAGSAGSGGSAGPASGYGYPPAGPTPGGAPGPGAAAPVPAPARFPGGNGSSADFVIPPPPGGGSGAGTTEQPYPNLPGGFGPPQPGGGYQQQPGEGYEQPDNGDFHVPGSFAPQPPQPATTTTWVAVVNADREYFQETMARSGPDVPGLSFPPYSPERRVQMTGRGQLRIGRRSHHRGTVPEIDLSTPPEDPGASHNHALLQEQPDGGWVVIDQDSTNGTTLNGSPDAITPHMPVPLADGDRIHIGAWTTITVQRV
ncbi:FHA domain-containing protein [Phaeacidiphilus oryzae]|uniref:FHA domain-containing protein n=1 Tax=Phaeacidiphilus oryzae TaxID=348818 RepID=UPI000562657E|nr:FHA domain-containing protein [Phaeacidiphilus oryzae]